jgi:hypothetical protein
MPRTGIELARLVEREHLLATTEDLIGQLWTESRTIRYATARHSPQILLRPLLAFKVVLLSYITDTFDANCTDRTESGVL